MQRRDLVVEVLAALVEAAQRRGQRVAQECGVDRRSSFASPRCVAATVSSALSRRRASPSASANSMLRARVVELQPARGTRASARSSSACKLVARQRLQHVHRRARQQRADHFERRVLGGRADEHEQARFDVRQERVLLRLVEAMHLVDEQDGRPARLRAALACARSTASRMSFTPPSTAEIAMNSSPNASAISRASVVLPTPGGPHRIIECGRPDSNATRSGLPGPSRCAWPITSSMFRGRIRSASGAPAGG